MRVLNEAGIPDDRLKAITEFIKTRSIYHRHIAVLLTNEPDPQAPRAGFMTADAYPGGGWRRGYKEKHFVKVYVPTLERPYPVSQQNPAVSPGGSCPLLDLMSWEEELVVVLAHEFEHVRQYVEEGNRLGVESIVSDVDQSYEVAAENRGFTALVRWRSQQSMRKEMALSNSAE